MRRLREIMFGPKPAVDPQIEGIIRDAITTVWGEAEAAGRLCLNLTRPTQDGGWICTMPRHHTGTHAAHGRDGRLLHLWEQTDDTDPTPPLGIERPVS